MTPYRLFRYAFAAALLAAVFLCVMALDALGRAARVLGW